MGEKEQEGTETILGPAQIITPGCSRSNPQTRHPPSQQGACSKLWEAKDGVGGRGGLSPWDPLVGLRVVGLLKPSSPMGNGEKPEGEMSQRAFS